MFNYQVRVYVEDVDLAPARLADPLRIETIVKTVGRTSITFAQQIVCKEDENILCRGEVQVVVINDKFRPVAIPRDLLSCLIEE